MLGKVLAKFPTQTSEKWQQLIFWTQKTSVRFPNSNPNINNSSLEKGVVKFVKDHHIWKWKKYGVHIWAFCGYTTCNNSTDLAPTLCQMYRVLHTGYFWRHFNFNFIYRYLFKPVCVSICIMCPLGDRILIAKKTHHHPFFSPNLQSLTPSDMQVKSWCAICQSGDASMAAPYETAPEGQDGQRMPTSTVNAPPPLT